MDKVPGFLSDLVPLIQRSRLGFISISGMTRDSMKELCSSMCLLCIDQSAKAHDAGSTTAKQHWAERWKYWNNRHNWLFGQKYAVHT